MPLKNGDAVLIISHDKYENKAAQVVSVDGESITVKLWDGTDQIVVDSNSIKRKARCVCGMSNKKPFCDGSHAGS